MVEGGPNDLGWVHPEVKMATASLHWCNSENIKELETHFRTEEEMEGIDFEPVELDERVYNYDTGRFIMFYGDIMVKLWIDPPFSMFQANVLNAVGVCPSQLTWNAWPSSCVLK